MTTHSSILAMENPHGQRRLVGYSPWGSKELDTTERLKTAQSKTSGVRNSNRLVQAATEK